MIDLYTWPTPNGHKVHILLEELKVPYKVIPININKGDQFKKSFLKISPNNKMPAMVDKDGPSRKPISLFESGAILIYLAEKYEKFLPKNTRSKYEVIQWLMFQMASVGPMLGQAHHFRNYAPKKIPYAINRYTNEATRIYSVINRRLKKSKYIANNNYSIADIAIFPWLRSYANQGQKLEDYPNLKKWYDKIDQRPATKRALEVLKDKRRVGSMSKEAKENLFGKSQYLKR
ncbi:MAG: glutathione S-transferase [Rhodospirillaceae bacterium]|nr:glutathione S-transferase [Rhodospirillaceae bacterium]